MAAALASRAPCGAVVRAVAGASVARPAGTPVAPSYAGNTSVFMPQRPLSVRSRRMVTAVKAANGTGLPIDLRGEPWGAPRGPASNARPPDRASTAASASAPDRQRLTSLTRASLICRQEGLHCWRG